jgi:hypothetical protein
LHPCPTSPSPTLSHPDPRDLAAATPEEIAEVLSYALRSDERGKALRGGWDFAAGLAAERLTEHLRWSAFVVMRARPARPHNAGQVAAMVDSDIVIDLKRGSKPEWQHTQDYWAEKNAIPAIDLTDAAFVYA